MNLGRILAFYTTEIVSADYAFQIYLPFLLNSCEIRKMETKINVSFVGCYFKRMQQVGLAVVQFILLTFSYYSTQIHCFLLFVLLNWFQSLELFIVFLWVFVVFLWSFINKWNKNKFSWVLPKTKWILN